MNISNEQLAGRIAAVELILIQALAIAGARTSDKDTLFSVLRESFDDRSDRLPDAVRLYAVEAADRIYASALETAKQWPEQK